jgi:hypothetical protein
MTPRTMFLAAILVAALAPLASANQCPADIKKIDAAMAGAQLGQEQMAEVKRLRDEGQQLHEQGNHSASMATLARAKEMLGVP